MRVGKLTSEQREVVRRQRFETLLILAKFKELSFEYVVNPPPLPKIAFGSTLHRECLPTAGPNLSAFMRRNQGEVRSYPGPLEYNPVKPIGFEYPSAAGFSSLASKTPRLPKFADSGFPPLGAYHADIWKPTDKNGFTFAHFDERADDPKWLPPGPSTYPFHLQYPQLDVSSAFGTKRIIWPNVAVFCAPYNQSHCFKCNKTPFGDYFHNFNTNQDICRPCMHQTLAEKKRCSLQVMQRALMNREIQQFRPARYCGFFHDHNGTNAAKELTSRRELRKKIETENYLYRFHSKEQIH